MTSFQVSDEIAVRVDPDTLRDVTTTVFERCGVPRVHAELGADVMLYADTRGIDSHGVSNKLRDYVNKYDDGTLNPAPSITVVRETPSTAVVDGDRGLGLMVAPRAMEIAIEKAATVGTGVVAVRNSGHVGAAGYYASMAVQRDMIGWCTAVSHAPKSMLPTHGAEPRLGTNPIAFGAPAGTEAPFLFDAAMTTIAGNKIGLARRNGLPMEPGWVAHPDGTPDMTGGPLDATATTKPNQLPLGSNREMGSHKGYSLAVMVEILSGQLSFAPGFGTMAPDRGGHFVAAYDISAFGDPEEFKANMDGMLRGLRTTPPMPGQDRVVYAGLPESETLRDRTSRGIPLHPEVIAWFRSICERFEIPMLEEFRVES